MTGLEHYREAERRLQNADDNYGVDEDESRHDLAAAQVHATLALAASQLASIKIHTNSKRGA